MYFYLLIKMHALFSHTYQWKVKVCVAAIGACVFKCVASAAHFFYFQEDEKMKKMLALILAVVMMLSVCGCGKAQTEENDVSNGDDLEETVNTSQGPSGKYYYELLDSVYYEFDGEDNCYLVSESNNAKTSYLYVFDKNATYEGAEGIFVIHISDINSGGSHKLVYDSIEDTIWDPDFGIFEKK